jgi:hypothetical protein
VKREVVWRVALSVRSAYYALAVFQIIKKKGVGMYPLLDFWIRLFDNQSAALMRRLLLITAFFLGLGLVNASANELIDACIASSSSMTYAICKTKIESASPEEIEMWKQKADAGRVERQASKMRREAEDAAKQAAFLELLVKQSNAQAAAFIDCPNKKACEKAFALTEVFISQQSDMKIQLATGTTIETYHPSDAAKVGMKAIKMPTKGDSSRISLAIECKSDKIMDEPCVLKTTSSYLMFRAFMNENAPSSKR